ncbi:hypothetical protein [Nonomuraea salmonea]|uniref:MmyB family transcriptional regulator n=1 Tax=Nonomuraea salmonea TaxID=46181 RepID=UPI002FED8230
MYRLAGEPPARGAHPPDTEIRPGLQRLLRRLDDTLPITVHDGRLDLLARNAAAAALFGPLPAGGRYARNIVHQCFTATTALCEVLGDAGTEHLTRVARAELRSALGRYPADDYLQSLFTELWTTSTTFRTAWARGEVGALRSAAKRVHHPTRGWLDFDIELLHDPESDHWIMLYNPRETA